MHITSEQAIYCPFKKCQKKYNILSSFTSHLSKVHKKSSVLLDNASNNSSENIPADVVDEVPLDVNNDFDILEHAPESNLFLKNLAQFYLKLESDLLVPASTIQYIASVAARELLWIYFNWKPTINWARLTRGVLPNGIGVGERADS